mmetsp:Transcript_2150/g.5081  ORF Transcript_2150/g.5081 Transcript_2150/m.5081 type:complete len:299 (-) Transcript_2150:611-1507(-)
MPPRRARLRPQPPQAPVLGGRSSRRAVPLTMVPSPHSATGIGRRLCGSWNTPSRLPSLPRSLPPPLRRPCSRCTPIAADAAPPTSAPFISSGGSLAETEISTTPSSAAASLKVPSLPSRSCGWAPGRCQIFPPGAPATRLWKRERKARAAAIIQDRPWVEEARNVVHQRRTSLRSLPMGIVLSGTRPWICPRATAPPGRCPPRMSFLMVPRPAEVRLVCRLLPRRRSLLWQEPRGRPARVWLSDGRRTCLLLGGPIQRPPSSRKPARVPYRRHPSWRTRVPGKRPSHRMRGAARQPPC